jgi:ribosomal protein S16
VHPVEFVVDADKVKKWLAQGALPSDTVSRLLQNADIIPKVARKAAPAAK